MTIFKTSIFVFFSLITLLSKAGFNLDITYEKTSQGYRIVANNQEYCPVSAEVSFNLKNLKPSTGNQQVFVIPAKTERHVVTELIIVKPSKAIEFGYQFKSTLGDVTLNTYDDDFYYSLPFATGSSYLISQGYNGNFSHQHKNALDFDLPMGSAVHAIRDGIVIETVEKHTKHCTEASCRKFNNYVLVYHNDGTFAAYSHINTNGVKPEVGDHIKQDELIAYSGNTGWTSGPHLHLEIYLPRFEDRKTIKTLFKINDGREATYLKEQEVYSKNY